MSTKQVQAKAKRSAARELGTETDAVVARKPEGVKLPKVDPKRLNTKADDSRSFERGALVSYFRDIADIPTLQKEHEVLLAKEIEAATRDFRQAILSIPWTATEVVGIWQGLKQEGRATGKMSESFGSGSPDGEDLGAADGDADRVRAAGIELLASVRREGERQTAGAQQRRERDLGGLQRARERRHVHDARIAQRRRRRALGGFVGGGVTPLLLLQMRRHLDLEIVEARAVAVGRGIGVDSVDGTQRVEPHVGLGVLRARDEGRDGFEHM